jgi:hypothetical protein
MLPATTTPPLNYRLPTNLSPYLYEVTIQPYLKLTEEPSYYLGRVRIHFTCVSNTNQLVFHLKNIQVYDSSLLLTSSSDLTIGQVKEFAWTKDERRDFFVANFNSTSSQTTYFKAGNNYSVEMQFKGFLQNDNVGFYKASYPDSGTIK